MSSDKSSILHIVTIVIIIVMNIPLLYLTIKIIITAGGPWGFGIMVLPLLLISHLFLISAFKGIKNPNKSNLTFYLNGFGAMYCTCLVYICLTSVSQ